VEVAASSTVYKGNNVQVELAVTLHSIADLVLRVLVLPVAVKIVLLVVRWLAVMTKMTHALPIMVVDITAVELQTMASPLALHRVAQHVVQPGKLVSMQHKEHAANQVDSSVA